MLHVRLIAAKVKAELESQAEAVAAAYSKVEHAEGENKSSLARAKLIEAEVSTVIRVARMRPLSFS